MHAGNRTPIAILVIAIIFGGCTVNLHKLQETPRAAAVTTGGPWTSMVFAARTDAGVILIDLGWDPTGERVREALDRIGASPAEVAAVFLTHSHRDHVAGWRTVQHATFHLAEPEVPRFLGEDEHRGLVPRIIDRIVPPDLPQRGEVELVSFDGDTAFAFGADTVRAFAAPGHTAGSAVYLFRDVLFLGDAISHTPGLGFQPARPVHTDDSNTSRASLEALWPRVLPLEPRLACTAHARCAAIDAAFLADVRS